MFTMFSVDFLEFVVIGTFQCAKTRTYALLSENPPGRPDSGRKRGRVRGNPDVW